MPVSELPVINLGSNQTLRSWVALLRDYMRDYPQLNRLIEGEETSDRMLAFAVMFSVDRFNITPPLLGRFGPAEVPAYFVLHGAAAHVLKSAGLLQSRNQFDYNAGGVAVQHSNKTPLYQAWIQMFDSEWHQMVKTYKVALNIEGAYGHAVASEYLFLNGFFGDF